MEYDLHKRLISAYQKLIQNDNSNNIFIFKKGGIYIKKQNRGKFTEYCGGKVTDECIQRGKNSKDPKIRKRATFAANVRKWNKKDGGELSLKPLKSFPEITQMTNQNYVKWIKKNYV